MSVVTSIISAKLTTTALTATYIMALKDVTQTLCVEVRGCKIAHLPGAEQLTTFNTTE